MSATRTLSVELPDDDLCDAATEAIEAANARIKRLNLELTPASFKALRALLCEALKLAQARSADPRPATTVCNNNRHDQFA